MTLVILNREVDGDKFYFGEHKKADLPRFWCKRQSKVVNFVNGRFNFVG